MTGRAFPAEPIADRLNKFLRLSAGKHQKDNVTRVFVAVAEGSSEVLGYYALNAHSVATEEFGEDSPKRAPRTGSIPALYLSMIEVDGRRQGKEHWTGFANG